MLNNYDLAATAENWVHEAILAKISTALAALDAGELAPPWEDGLCEELKSRDALAALYDSFCVAACSLSSNQRRTVRRALFAQNNIPAVFDGISACPRADQLPQKIRSPARALFQAAFDSLGRLKVRDRQYDLIFGTLPGKCCPFCGLELFEAPGLAREDLDHYLPISLYPFAGANLRNLAPMGGKCNSAYKNAKDVLFNQHGGRRRCFDPYGQARANISLLKSRPFEGEIRGLFPIPLWTLDLIGDASRTTTWDEVFQIRRRYLAKATAHYREWIEDFASWCALEVAAFDTPSQVIDGLERYLSAILRPSRGEAAVLREALFEMLKKHCQNGEHARRLTDWLVGMVRASSSSWPHVVASPTVGRANRVADGVGGR